MWATWVLTVASVKYSRAAISLLESPWAISSSTSRSRAVSWSSGLDPGGGSGGWGRERGMGRRGVGGGGERRLAQEACDETTGDGGREQGVAPGNDADGVHELFGRGVLEEEAAGA